MTLTRQGKSLELIKDFQVTTELWPHQKDAVAFSNGKEGFMLALEMGCGKSVTAIKIAHDRNCHRVLVVCPKNVMDVWQSEIAKHTDIDSDYVFLIRGTRNKKIELLQESLRCDQSFIIINYDAVWRSGIGNFIMMNLFDKNIDMIITDELHRCKSNDSQVSLFFNKISSLCENRIGLTGTPFHNSPLDIFGQYRFLKPEIYGTNWFKFMNRYAITRQLPGRKGSFIVGFRNQDDLKQKFEQIAFVVKSEDVLKLPEQIFIERFFELKGGNKKGYKRILKRKEEIKHGGGKQNEYLTLFLKMQQMTSGMDVDMNEIYYDRMKALEEIFDDIDTNEPLIIFSRFHHDLDMIKRVAIKIGRKSFEFSGRIKEIGQWRENVSDGAILIAQIQTAKEGISLTEAKYAIYYSLPLSLGDYQQILKRLHRPGQKRDVTYIHLLAKDTIDEKIMEALKKKIHVTNYLLEDCDD